MNDAPWAADRPLGEEQARAAIESQFPDRTADDVVFLGSGWDYDAWARGGWVYRFPRRRVVADGQPSEIAALALAAEALAATGVRVPVVERHGQPSEHFPYPFTGARRIPGVTGDRLRGDPGNALAAALGAALAALHGVPPARARAAGIRAAPGTDAQRLAQVGVRAGEIRAALPPDLVTRYEPWLRGEVELPPSHEGRACLLHFDMCDEHVLVDPRTGLPTGLIDFADAALGDPVLDLVGPALWLGFARTSMLLASYAPVRPPGFDARLRFLARVRALLWLSDCVRIEGAASERHLRWVRRALELR